jgi:hypothetical protein
MPDAEILSIKVQDETTGVIFSVYPDGQSPFVTWTLDWSARWGFSEIKVRNNTNHYILIYLDIVFPDGSMAERVEYFSPGETKTYSFSMGPLVMTGTYKVRAKIGDTVTHNVPFTIYRGCFVKTIPFHPNAWIEYTKTGLLSDKIPGWLIYSHGTTVTLTVKLGWDGGAKGWGGAWLIDGAFNPNPVTLTVDHNITAQSLPGAFSPFLPFEDVNLDGIVDIMDILSVAFAFGAVVGTPKYDPNLDFNGDGIIDIEDILSSVRAFGKANEPPPRTETLYGARAAVSAMASQAMAGAAATAAGIILAETARKIMREVKK